MADTVEHERIKYIDAIKGFTIILVVLGHSIQTNIPNFDANLIFKVIYSFHMALFMFVSGYLTKFDFDFDFAAFIKKKFNILVIPFICWYLLGYLILWMKGQIIPLYTYIYQLIKSPDHGLWFLWVLFLCNIVLAVSVKLSKNLKWVAFLIILIFLNLFHWGFFALNFLQWFYTFFLAGYLVRWCINGTYKQFTSLAVTSFFLYPILYLGWHRIDNPNLVQKLKEIIPSHKIFIYVINAIYGRLISFTAITFIFFIFYKLDKSKFNNSKLYNWLCWLGMYTFDIYVIHHLFLYGIGHGVIRVISCAIISILISLLLSFFMFRKSKILTILFLGNRKNS